jgi:hypothetical protein
VEERRPTGMIKRGCSGHQQPLNLSWQACEFQGDFTACAAIGQHADRVERVS